MSNILQHAKKDENYGPLPARVAYDLAATFYDRRAWMKFWSMNEKPRVLELLGELRGRRILDIGCGTGFYGVDLVSMVSLYCGVDVSPRMIAQFRKKLTNLPSQVQCRARLICGDGEELPLKEAVFGACLAVRTLSHVENLAKTFGEVWRALGGNGILVVADLHGEHLYDYATLQDPDSGKRIPVVTYKRLPKVYVHGLKQAGFQHEAYEEVTYSSCRWQAAGQEEFDKLEKNPKNPIFFVAKFRKPL